MLDWLETPALTASIGVLLFGMTTFIVAVLAVAFAVSSMWLKPSRAERALEVSKELRLLVTALKGSAAD